MGSVCVCYLPWLVFLGCNHTRLSRLYMYGAMLAANICQLHQKELAAFIVLHCAGQMICWMDTQLLWLCAAIEDYCCVAQFTLTLTD